MFTVYLIKVVWEDARVCARVNLMLLGYQMFRETLLRKHFQNQKKSRACHSLSKRYDYFRVNFDHLRTEHCF